jgi:membrane-bound lytic murein transglycosylase D
MKRKCNVSSFLVVVVLLVASRLGLAQSVQSAPAAQDQEPFAEINQRLNEAADAKLANSFPSSPMSGTPDSKMEMRLPLGPLAVPTQLKEAFARRAIPKRSLARLDLLRPIIEPELARAGLPVELSGMVQVESGAQTFALSPRGARGLWQLMPDTARRYGLTVTTQRDERLDAYKSTRAAARYLRTLYARFGDWSLVFAAYNAGEQTIQRAIDRSGTTAFFQLTRLLPAETRSYVPAVWASFAQFSDSGRTTHLGSLLRDRPNTRIVYAETTTSSSVGHEAGQ